MADVNKSVVEYVKGLEPNEDLDPIECLNLDNQLNLPNGNQKEMSYVSVSVLDAAITIERHGGNYHIAARAGHELYFHDICLKYRNRETEDLIMKPESSESSAFNVTKNTTTSVNPSVALVAGPSPSANVSLGLTRSAALTVQYTVNTWTTTAHQVSGDTTVGRQSCFGTRQENQDRHERYRWFWAGTHEETKKLTPDLKHSVKRHVVVRRVIPIGDFPVQKIASAKRLLDEEVETAKEQRYAESVEQSANGTKNGVTLKMKETTKKATAKATKAREARASSRLCGRRTSLRKLLHFEFSIHVRVKRRYGRLHRLMVLSFNDMKSSFLKPTLVRDFSLKGYMFYHQIPLRDTYNIAATLDEIKDNHLGVWDKLEGMHIIEIQGYEQFVRSQKASTNWIPIIGNEKITRALYSKVHDQSLLRHINTKETQDQSRKGKQGYGEFLRPEDVLKNATTR
ncbi:hypothetical protein EG329_014254 [Mollisiaceae sp. DMI_Dod_QoI]|nr:hypothetical protein EG329_014254 [Helotiales sp. DMI_Dod_QoI]